MPGVVSKVSSGVGDFLSTLYQYIQDHWDSLPSNYHRALVTVAAASGVLLLWKLSQPKLPPGPRALPLIGNLHQLGKEPRFERILERLKKEHGDIMTLYFGPKPIVFLNSAELVREAFIRQTDVTSNRMYSLVFDLLSEGGMDIVGANYDTRMQLQRKLAHQALRKFSMAGGLENYTSQAFAAMCEELDKNPELNGVEMGFVVAYSILLSMAFGKKFSFSDPFLRKMMKQTEELDDLLEFFSLRDLFPIFRYLPYSKTNKLFKKIMTEFLEYLERTWDEHMESFGKGKVSDFTYQLISVMKEAEQDENDRKNMKLLTKRHYLHVLNDLFQAGTETTRLTLNWVWHYLAAYPEVQKRAQDEVDSVLGRDGKVTANCRDSLPYVDAFLHEVMRIRPVVQIGLFHETTAPMELGGYHLPKGTALVCNTWSIHMEEKNWPDPEAFLPERWLDENGQYVFQKQGFVPFSMGRRSCVGESFVKIELHMLTTMFLQKYTVSPTPGYTASVKPLNGAAMKPEEQKPLVVKAR